MKDILPTPIETLYQAREIGLAKGLRFVYFGNFLGQGNQDTVCPNCENVLIQRYGFKLVKNQILNNQCPSCGTKIPGVGLSYQVA